MIDHERAAKKASHGWFETPGRSGDRTLAEQLTGLDPLFAEIEGKTVLDVGCAEGLIAMECCRRGARGVFGVEIVKAHVEVANRLREDLPCEFQDANANEWKPNGRYDVVLLLAILHKLKDPSAACRRFAKVCDDLCVIRFPAISLDRQIIVDDRSGSEPHDIGTAMRRVGFRLEQATDGPRGEKTYFYRR